MCLAFWSREPLQRSSQLHDKCLIHWCCPHSRNEAIQGNVCTDWWQLCHGLMIVIRLCVMWGNAGNWPVPCWGPTRDRLSLSANQKPLMALLANQRPGNTGTEHLPSPSCVLWTPGMAEAVLGLLCVSTIETKTTRNDNPGSEPRLWWQERAGCADPGPMMWHRAWIHLSCPHGTDIRHRTWHWQLVTGTTLHGPSYLGQPLGGPRLWSQSRSTSSLIASDTGHWAPWVTSLLHLSHRRQGIPGLCL